MVNSFSEIAAANRQFFSTIHRARVQDVQIKKGTVSVQVESTDVVISDILMPFIGMSMPPQPRNADGHLDTGFDNGGLASWGRYIAQVGDVLLIGFGMNGDPYALGYHSLYYQGMGDKDLAKKDVGGIGWGDASDVHLESGDWDFKSRRNSRLLLTDKAILYSGPHNFTLDKSVGAVTLTTTLSINVYGSASMSRQGEVRRLVLPTDSAETPLYGMFKSVAQESHELVKRGSLVIPGGQVMYESNFGEVTDEATFLPMSSLVSFPELKTLAGPGVRSIRRVKDDATGKVDLFVEILDNLGNMGVTAPAATAMQWFTPAAVWTIENSVVDWKAIAQFGITSPMINLGGVKAVSPVVKGDALLTELGSLAVAVGVATATVGSAPQNAIAIAALGQAIIQFATLGAAKTLSKGTFTQ